MDEYFISSLLAYQGGSDIVVAAESTPLLELSALRDKLAKDKVLIELSSLHLGREIGSGCFGKVFRGVLDEVTTDGEIIRTSVAIKTLKGLLQITYQHNNIENYLNLRVIEKLNSGILWYPIHRNKS